MKRTVVLVAYNIRSCHNVGSLLRTADGLGVKRVYLTGYTPYPLRPHDTRLPNLAARLDRQIAKVALGAEKSVNWTFTERVEDAFDSLSDEGFKLVALEQDKRAVNITRYQPSAKIAIVVGPEVEGLSKDILDKMDAIVQIKMSGKKESFNVSVAAAIGLFHLTQA